MRIKGTRLICDKCGTHDFTHQTDFGSYVNNAGPDASDGFYTNEGCMLSGWSRRQNKDLCPVCTRMYDDAITEFFRV